MELLMQQPFIKQNTLGEMHCSKLGAVIMQHTHRHQCVNQATDKHKIKEHLLRALWWALGQLPRLIIPISATNVRQNPFPWRDCSIVEKTTV